MSLVGTSWRVVTLDGHAAAQDAIPNVSFEDGANVTLWTGCREVVSGYGLDTDGAALNFGPLPPPSDQCPPATAGAELEFLEAQGSIDSWSIINRDKIRFYGDAHEIILERQAGP